MVSPELNLWRVHLMGAGGGGGRFGVSGDKFLAVMAPTYSQLSH